MGKERMKMQENMNPAPEGAQTPADEEAAREAARLSQLKADMLVLIDTVADSSRDVKLIDGDTLFERFAKRASVAEAPEVDELVREAEADIDAVLGRTDGVSANVVKFRSKSEMKAHADEVATQKAQRRVFSRREVIQNLLAGNVASVVKAAEAAMTQMVSTGLIWRRARSRASTSTRCSPACSRATTASVLWKAGTR